MPILRTFARAALVLVVVGVVVSWVMVGLGQSANGDIIVVTFQRNHRVSHFGIFDQQYRLLHIYPSIVPANFGNYSWSPSGRYAVDTGYGTERIYFLDTLEGTYFEVPQNIVCIEWSPVSRYIACRRNNINENEIFIVDVETHTVESLVQVEKLYGFKWSRNGEEIAYIEVTEEASTLYVVDFMTKQVIFSSMFPPSFGLFDWSPDNEHLLIGNYVDGKYKLYLFSLETGELQSLNEDFGTEFETITDFAWSPSGSYLAFQTPIPSDYPFNYGSLYILEVATGNLRLLSDEGMTPLWSPTREELLFSMVESSSAAFTGQVSTYLIDVENLSRQRITDMMRNYGWSPSGDHVLLSFEGELYITDRNEINIFPLVSLSDNQEVDYGIVSSYAYWRP